MIELRGHIELPPTIITPDFPTPPSRPPAPIFQGWNQPILSPDAFGNFPFDSFDDRYTYTVVVVLLDSIKAMQHAYAQAQAALLPSVMAGLTESGFKEEFEQSSLAELEKSLKLLDELINTTLTQIPLENARARAFFGGRNPHDFTGVKAFDYMYKQLVPRGAVNKVYKAWIDSYQAQYRAQLLEQQLTHLSRQREFLEFFKTKAENQPPPPTPPRPQPQKTVPMALGALAVPASAGISLRAALSTAVTRVVTAGAATGAAAIGSTVAIVAGVLAFPTTLGDGTRFPATLPLNDLHTPDDDLQDLAAREGSVSLPVRMGLMGENEHVQLYVTNTKNGVPDNVRVRQARFDATQGIYSFTTADTPPRTLIWTPVASPGDSSTVSPPSDIPKPDYNGPVLVPVDPYIEEFPSVAEGGFDDYIIIFPADSGLEPVYVMFRDPRDEPGVASGEGVRIEGAWLPSAANEGARIPESIASQLVGKEFTSFNEFRKSFWRAVSEDSALVGQLTASQIAAVSKGNSPIAPNSGIVGRRIRYELHHITYISKNGEVYDIDNLRIMTPRAHIDLHSAKEE